MASDVIGTINGLTLVVLPADQSETCQAFAIIDTVYVLDQGSPRENEIMARRAAQQTMQNSC